MKLLLLIFLSCSCLNYVKTDEDLTDPCTTECDQTEYSSFIKCLYDRRHNVTASCAETTCSECDCNYCKEFDCEPYCKRCCYQNYCKSHVCCETSCHAQCKSSTCKNECIKTCTLYFPENLAESGELNDAAVEGKETVIQQNSSFTISIPANTTNFPIYINHTDGNITISNDFNTSDYKNNSCCTIISPKQCVPYAQYPFIKCFHLRKQACGPQCKTSTIHEQPHEMCIKTIGGMHCRLHNVYIPQPEPKCIYQPYWPYVSCGIQEQPFCGGCYAHYNNQNIQSAPPSCPFNCYDDGYDVGPYYRQGPFYRPGYAHAPSCFQTGTCNLYNSNYFGNNIEPFPYPPSPAKLFQGCAYPSNSYVSDLHIDPIYNNLPNEVDIIVTVSPSTNKRHAEITIQNTTLSKNIVHSKTEK